MSALGSLVVSLSLEYAAYTRGLDKSSQEALKFAKTSQQAFSLAGEALKGLVQGALAAGVAYLSVSKGIEAINHSIEDLSNLQELSEKTGSSVENLSKMQKVVTQFGGDFGSVDAALSKLAKGMATVDSETSKAHHALSALNLNDFSKTHDASEVMIEIAKRLQGYADGAGKAALATDLFGKSGADLIPYLNDLAENVDKMTGASAEAAKQADDFKNQMGGLKLKVDELFEGVSVDLLPALNDLASIFIDSLNASKELGNDKSALNWADELALAGARVYDTFANVAHLIKAITGSFNVVYADIKVAASSFGNTANGRFGGVKNSGGFNAALTERNKALADANAGYDSLLNADRSAAENALLTKFDTRELASFFGTGHSGRPKSVKAKINYETGNKPKDKAAQASDYDKLTRSINEKIAADQQELTLGDKLTESEKILSKLISDRATGAIDLTNVEFSHIKVLLQKLSIEERDLELTKLRKDAEVEYEKILSDTADAQNKENEAIDASIQSINDAAQTREDENARIGKTTEQLAALDEARFNEKIGLLETQKAYLEDQGGRELELEQIDKQIDALNRLHDAEGATAPLQKAAQEHKNFWDSIENTAHQVWTNVGQQGNNVFKSIGQTIKSAILDMLYQITIKKWIIGISASVESGGASASTGAIGSLFNSGGGGGGSILDSLSAGSQVSALNNIVQSFAGTVSNMGLDKLGAAIFQNSSAISSALPFAGAAFNLLTGNLKGAAISGLSTAIGSFTPLGPIGGAIVGQLLGSVFGGGEHGKGDRVQNNYSNGRLINGNQFSGDKGGSLGAGSSLSQLGTVFAQTVSSFLNVYGIDSNIRTDASFGSKKGNSHTDFSGYITTGGKLGGFGTYSQGDFAAGVNDVLSKGVVQALQASTLPAGIKKFFDGLTDRTAVGDTITALTNFHNTLANLPPIFDAIRNAIDTTSYKTSIADLQTRFSAINTYTSLFYTQQENFDQYTKQIKAQFGALNETFPKTRDEYRKLVDGIKVTDKSSSNLFNSLVALAPAMDQFFKQIDQLKGAVDVSRTDFSSIADFANYTGVAANYGTTFASDYTSNLDSGRISYNASGQAVVTGTGQQVSKDDILSLRKAMEAVALFTQQTASLLRKFDGDGLPETRVLT